MASNWWNFEAFQQNSHQFLSNEAHSGFSHFFRRPAKVVKSTSRNQSPRNLSRRRMTTQMPTRARSVIDPSKDNRTSQWLPNRQDPTRPTSWHPMSIESSHVQGFQQPTFYPPDMAQFSFQPAFTTANVNGLVTPMSYPITDDSQIHELIPPLDELPVQDTVANYFPASQFEDQYYLSFKPSVSEYNNPTPAAYDQQPCWAIQYSYSAQIPTAPASPEFLAMPDVGKPFGVAVDEPSEQKDELVGMGLYDSPAEVQTSSLLFGDWTGMGKRKSLKLEESFEPKPPSESADDDDDQNLDDIEADSHSENLLDDAESEPVFTADVPVMEDRLDSYTQLRMVTGIQECLGGQLPSGSHAYGWV